MAFIDIPPAPPAIVEVHHQESVNSALHSSTVSLQKQTTKPLDGRSIERSFSQGIEHEIDIDGISRQRGLSTNTPRRLVNRFHVALDRQEDLPILEQAEDAYPAEIEVQNPDNSNSNLGPEASDSSDSGIESSPIRGDEFNEPSLEIPLQEETAPLILDQSGRESRLDITADYQDYDPIRQIVTAEGNVQLRINDAILLADKLWVNILNRYTLAEGNVLLTRGEQVIRGERAEYSYILGSGILFEAQGDIFSSTLATDVSSPLVGSTTSRSIFDPLNPDRAVSDIESTGGLEASTSQGQNFANTQGGIRRFRFQAERVYFDADLWEAEDVRITNDPFSPPELEFRTDRLELVALSEEEDLLTARRPRLVFDQGFSLPLFRSQFILQRGELDPSDLNPFPTAIGIDGRDRGGLFIERSFDVIKRPNVSLGITPQYLVTRAISNGIFDASALGAEIDLKSQLGPRTTLVGNVDISSLELDEFTENLRASVRAQQLIGNHALALEYSFRDRLFNGSLGFQDVRSNVGALLLSPTFRLTDSGLLLNYQLGAQYITSETDRSDLLGANPPDNLVSLGRFQANARLSHGFTLWQGKALPATREEGLRYSPFPIKPSLTLGAGIQGQTTYYTSDDFQGLVAGDLRLDVQLGHLAKSTFDYTRFNIGYYRAFAARSDSPFTFDRVVDQNVLSFGLMQQVYGPLLLGFQTSLNLDTGRGLNTEIIAEYSRRTYGILVRYSPTQSTGAIGFRLSDFNWIGNSNPFDNPRIRNVEGGVVSP